MTTSGNARTRWTRLPGVFCVAFCAAALALPARAEPAGKVLTADGDVLVLRGSQILRLSRGAAVETGDQIHTGTDGKVLIVFTDSGLVWIRANSDFVVDEYSYAQGGREAAFFSLLKGGARSVTGLIGRRTRSNFRLRVPAARIGIRATDFSVVMCQRDSRRYGDKRLDRDCHERERLDRKRDRCHSPCHGFDRIRSLGCHLADRDLDRVRRFSRHAPSVFDRSACSFGGHAHRGSDCST